MHPSVSVVLAAIALAHAAATAGASGADGMFTIAGLNSAGAEGPGGPLGLAIEHAADLSDYFAPPAKSIFQSALDAGPPEPPKQEAPPPLPSNEDLSFFAGWKGSIEFGLAGTTGNSDNFNLRAGINGERKTKETDTTAGFVYLYANSDGEKSTNRAELNLRNDWSIDDSPWSFFAQGRVEYDEFQDWRWRISAYAGPVYTFIKTEKTSLKGRFGLGASKEFVSPNEDIMPEALAGLDFTHQLTERQRIFYSGEYLPSLTEFPQFRVGEKAGWEILVDPEVKMTLKLGIDHRYQSNPGAGFKHNDLDYYAVLAWAF